MIKKFILSVLVSLPCCIYAQKLAVVDAETIVASMPETAENKENLRQIRDSYQNEFNILTDEINKKFAEYQALPVDTPSAIKERRQQEIQELANKMQRFQQQASQELEQQEQHLQKPIVDLVEKTIKEVGMEGGYSLILPKNIPFFMGSDIIDITEIVKSKLGI